MNSFSISDLQQFSGIKAHTIRIWEQRYNALKPLRSEGNTRYYTGDQLKRLLNIVSLMNDDYRISELCLLPDDKLYQLLKVQSSKSLTVAQTYNYYIVQIIAAAMAYDEMYFEKLFSNCILRFGLSDTYTNIIYPVLLRLGLWWSKSDLSPAQEHFLTNLFRQKLFAAIDALPPAKSTTESWVLFLPEDEFHEIGLLFANFLIRQAGKKVIYLGANIPIESLEAAVQVTNSENILFFLVRKKDSANDNEFISLVKKHFKKQKIYMACETSRSKDLKAARNFEALHSVEDLLNII